MTPLDNPKPDCVVCEGHGYALRICKHCDCTGHRDVRADWTPCFVCQGDGVTRHACDCIEWGNATTWGAGGEVRNG